MDVHQHVVLIQLDVVGVELALLLSTQLLTWY